MCKQGYFVKSIVIFYLHLCLKYLCLHTVGHSVGASLAFQSVGDFLVIIMIGACSVCHLGEYHQNLISYGHRGTVL